MFLFNWWLFMNNYLNWPFIYEWWWLELSVKLLERICTLRRHETSIVSLSLVTSRSSSSLAFNILSAVQLTGNEVSVTSWDSSRYEPCGTAAMSTSIAAQSVANTDTSCISQTHTLTGSHTSPTVLHPLRLHTTMFSLSLAPFFCLKFFSLILQCFSLRYWNWSPICCCCSNLQCRCLSVFSRRLDMFSVPPTIYADTHWTSFDTHLDLAIKLFSPLQNLYNDDDYCYVHIIIKVEYTIPVYQL